MLKCSEKFKMKQNNTNKQKRNNLPPAGLRKGSPDNVRGPGNKVGRIFDSPNLML